MVYLPNPLELDLQLTDAQFFQLCQQHRDLKFERNPDGEILIMPPTGGLTGNRNSDINCQLQNWNRHTKLGKVFDSSTGFKLPNGANRSPDTSWLRKEAWDALTLAEKEKFLPLCPNFAIELRSSSDRLRPTQAKMREYLENGLQLGWLIDPQRKVVEIYRPSLAVITLENPQILSGENILPGFELDLSEIFNSEK